MSEEYIENLIERILFHIESHRRMGRTTKMIERIRVWDISNSLKTAIVWCYNSIHRDRIFEEVSRNMYIIRLVRPQYRIDTKHRNVIYCLTVDNIKTLGIIRNESFEDHYTFEQKLYEVIRDYKFRKGGSKP